MRRLAWMAALAAAAAGPGAAQAPGRAPVTVTKVVSSIADGTEWIRGAASCPSRPRGLWNVDGAPVDVARLAQPVRNELRHEGVTVAADPDDPFGARITSDLMLGATITQIRARVCGAGDVAGQMQMQVIWELYSTAQKKVVVAVHTTVSVSTRDKPIPLIRLIGAAMEGSAKQVLLNGPFEAALVTAAVAPPAASGAARPTLPLPTAGAPTTQQYGPGSAHGDLVPHEQERLYFGGLGSRTKAADAVQSVVAILRPGSIGSAFLVSREGYLLTAAHVVGREAFVKVRWSDGYETNGEVVRRDNRRDVALIRTDPRGRPPLALKLEPPPVGQQVWAIGAPSALQGTVTRGIVSADRILDGFSFVQSDAAVNPGNSGGPLLYDHGEVVGIADLSLRNDPGINFFVPVGDALLFLGAEPRWP